MKLKQLIKNRFERRSQFGNGQYKILNFDDDDDTPDDGEFGTQSISWQTYAKLLRFYDADICLKSNSPQDEENDD